VVQVLAVGLGRLSPRAQTRVVRGAQVAVEVHVKSGADDAATHASAITFTMFLSILPLLLLGLWATSQVVEVGDAWLQEIFDAVPGLEQMVTGGSVDIAAGLGLGLVAAVGVLWSASAFSNRLQGAFARIFRRPPTAILGRLWSLVATLILLLLLLATTVATAAVGTLRIAFLPDLVTSLLGRVLLVALVFGYTLLLYWLLTPGRAIGVRDHVPGAIVFTVGWTILQLVGTAIVARTVARMSALYGAIGGLFGLLVFLRITAWLLLYGAELTSVLIRDRALGRGR
jgi:membrane protein